MIERGQPHALLIPVPVQGHINPMMQLAWKLISHGFLITFLNTQDTLHRISEANKKSSLPKNWDLIRMISVPMEAQPEDGRDEVIKFSESLDKGLGPPVILNLIQKINNEEEHKITCIIVDFWMCSGLQAVANFHGISLAVLHTQLLSVCAISYFSRRLISHGILPSNGIVEEDKMVNCLPSVPPMRSGELPWMNGGEYLFLRGNRMAQELKQIKWVLFNSLQDLEAPAVEELSKEVGVYTIGPLIPPEFLHGDSSNTTMTLPSLWTDELECLKWLDKQAAQSVIYLSFGSFTVLEEKQVEEIALGLEATKRPFLWVLRSDGMKGDKAVSISRLLESTGDQGCIVGWAPQLQVLGHPSLACFVTHCGWNSVEESMSMGVPMLCWPYFTDQFLNRNYIVDVWKVGLPLNPNKDGLIEKKEFRKAVEDLLVSEKGMEIREEVNKWKKIAKNAVKEGGSSSNNFNLFINAIKQIPVTKV
ncbi:hypothetical protein SUGI_0998200 [Cryptomeria japonica]|uniref:anthocyanidin 3-O-glucosyltransferase 7-like n=1 Tax=Cryptomeria japonica TaxID=3369 RepID=UPI002414718B|nr:anthocyanidin 3-O-glucosyltransferase 7-like [Cryptomeria japonica]GLJ47268.1 hypothetical protein SUGI_0998200 [Cryptomeria japonica]